jgi:hypothetical protein
MFKLLPQMAQQSPNKRSYVDRPGLAVAAKLLGCSYTHLRRVVAGKRSNPGLLSLYQQLSPASKASTTSPK